MKVKLRNPDRDVEVRGGRRVRDVLSDLRIDPDSVLVIRERDLLTRDEVGEDDRLEVRAFLRKIDYVVEQRPLVAGNTQLRYKRAMNELESSLPGTTAQFFLGFLDRGAALFEGEDDAELRPCESCGQPTTGRFCAFCRARGQILRRPLDVRSAPPATETSEPRPAEPDGDDDLGVARELSDEVLPAEIYGGSPR